MLMLGVFLGGGGGGGGGGDSNRKRKVLMYTILDADISYTVFPVVLACYFLAYFLV